MTCQEGKGLNVRPIEPALREALRALAGDAGQDLYQYVLGVLRQHVRRCHRRAGVGPATERTSA